MDSSEEPITQAHVDEAFTELKAEFDRLFSESGEESIAVFLVTNGSGEVGQLLAAYQIAKDHIESQGLVMPELVEGLSIAVSVQDEDGADIVIDSRSSGVDLRTL